jgi:sugar/nucleoside kinase (ribokinase family)
LTDGRQTKRKPHVLCAGNAVQDMVMRVEAFPAPGMKIRASDFVIVGGGCAANGAVAATRLGAIARYAGPLGGADDETSDNILRGLEQQGIDCSGAVRVAGAVAPVSLILLDAHGEKTIATRRGSGLTDAAPPDPERLLDGIDGVLIDNAFTAFVTPICEAARRRGLPVVMDLDRATECNEPLLKCATHLISSAQALRYATKVDDLKKGLVIFGRHVDCFLAVTDGPNGTYWLDNGKVRHVEAFKVETIDTLGAGDTFHGAFLFDILTGRNPVDAMRFAAAAAAIKCTRFGGLTGAPTYDEVTDFLRERSPAAAK